MTDLSDLSIADLWAMKCRLTERLAWDLLDEGQRREINRRRGLVCKELDGRINEVFGFKDTLNTAKNPNDSHLYGDPCVKIS